MISGRRKLITVTALAGALGIGLTGGAVPASAQPETVTLTLLNGLRIPLVMDVPAGSPLSSLKLPNEISPIVGISVTGAPGQSVAAAPSIATLPGTGAVPAPTMPATSSIPLVAGGKAQSSTGAKLGGGIAGTVFGAPISKTAALVKPLATRFRLSDGLPTAANPTLQIVPFAPVGANVPDFFIRNFGVPPFLLRIYQAAGTEYNVPWQVLAAINEIETDYGRNRSLSSAGAEGWMQFLPATWAQYGVDATGNGVKDPDNPVDAIFAAARYLHAAGASTNLQGAIFSYNHAKWYVDSVLLRAKLLGGMPADLVNSLTRLTEGVFPVAATSKYADDVAETAAVRLSVRQQNAPAPVTASAAQTATTIYAKAGSPAVAANDGTVVAMGHSAALGNYVKLADAFGNTYYYAGLKTLATSYPLAKTTVPASTARVASTPSDPKPTAAASAGHQAAVAAPATSPVTTVTQSTTAQATDGASPYRMFAHSTRPSTFGVSGAQSAAGSPLNSNYLTKTSGLNASAFESKTLAKGAHVMAGTVLGRIGKVSPVMAPHLTFMIRPAGVGSPLIDPKVILDGWELLAATAGSRSAANPVVGLTGTDGQLGKVLLESKSQLQRRVLSDPAVSIYGCGRQDVAAGLVDPRVLTVLEFLSIQGFKPTVSQLKCGATAATSGTLLAEQRAGDAVTISAINDIPLLGHQDRGAIADLVIQQLETLQGVYQPHDIVSMLSYPGTTNTVAIPTHTSSIQIGFLPPYDATAKSGRQVATALRPKQWINLIARLGAIANPVVSATPSPYAIPDNTPSGG